MGQGCGCPSGVTICFPACVLQLGAGPAAHPSPLLAPWALQDSLSPGPEPCWPCAGVVPSVTAHDCSWDIRLETTSALPGEKPKPLWVSQGLAAPSLLQRLHAESGLCHTTEQEWPLQQAKVKVEFMGFFVCFFFYCSFFTVPKSSPARGQTLCGNLQVLSYSSAHPRRRRKVGSETQVEKHY